MLRYLRENTGNWIIKIFLGIIVVVFVFLGVGSMGSKNDNSVAVIGDEPITVNEFQDAYRRLVEQMRQRFGDNLNEDLLKVLNVKQQAMDSLIEQKLVAKEAEKLDIMVSDKELQEVLISIPEFQIDGVFDLEHYKRILGLNSLNPEIFEMRQRAAMKENKVRDMVLSGITVSDMEARTWYIFENTQVAVNYIKVDPLSFTDVRPTEEQIKKEYEENRTLYQSEPRRKAVYLKFSPEDHEGEVAITDEQAKVFYNQNSDRFKIPEKVEARHILVKVAENADEALVETARKQALEIYERAAKGEDFAELAKEFSEGPSKDNGGYLGVFDKQSMVKPFADKAFAMKAGEISEPVRTQFGWHLINLMARFDASVESLAQAMEKIKSELKSQEIQNMAHYKAGEALDSIVDGDDLEQVALITNQKVMTTEAFTAAGEGLDLDEKTGFAQAAFAQVNDEISDVKQLGSSYYLIRVIEKIQPEPLSLDTAKDRIVQTLTLKLQQEAAKKSADALIQKVGTVDSLEQLAKENHLVLGSTELFVRNQPAEGIGNSPELVKAAFSLGRETPIHPSVLETDQGFFIIGYKEKQAPKDALVDENLKKTRDQLVWMKQGQHYKSWIEELKAKTEIQINSQFLN